MATFDLAFLAYIDEQPIFLGHKRLPIKSGISCRLRKNSTTPSLPRSLSQRKPGAGVHPAEGGTASAGMTLQDGKILFQHPARRSLILKGKYFQ
jgi:hypothetical protein